MMKFMVSFFIFAFLSIHSYSSIQLSAECTEGSFYGKSIYYKLVTNNNDYTISVGFGVSDTFTPSTFLRIFTLRALAANLMLLAILQLGQHTLLLFLKKLMDQLYYILILLF